ncbi:hypothetical protein [Bradyrhizobium guangdongense]
MGEAKLKQSATQKFIARYPRCALCGGERASETREHMPPKSLFDNSHRPDKLVMPSCDACNRGTSKADLTAALVSRWNYYSPQQELDDHSKLTRQIKVQAPELVSEWMRINDVGERQQGLQHLRNHGVDVPSDAGIVSIGPLTIRQLNIFAHKATLCLYFEHFKKPLPNTGLLSAHFRSKEDFAKGGVPSIFFELFPDYATLIQGKWNAAETFEYRYAVNVSEQLFGCLARLRTGLYVAGFAITDPSRASEPLGTDWIKPNQLLEENAHFWKKN